MGSYIEKDLRLKIREAAKSGFTHAEIQELLNVPEWAATIYAKRYLDSVDGETVVNYFFRGKPVPVSWNNVTKELFVSILGAAHAIGYESRFRPAPDVRKYQINGTAFVDLNGLDTLVRRGRSHRANLGLLLIRGLKEKYYEKEPVQEPVESPIEGERELHIQSLKLELEKQEELLKIETIFSRLEEIKENIKRIEEQQNTIKVTPPSPKGKQGGSA